jgi:hypothetical protein
LIQNSRILKIFYIGSARLRGAAAGAFRPFFVIKGSSGARLLERRPILRPVFRPAAQIRFDFLPVVTGYSHDVACHGSGANQAVGHWSELGRKVPWLFPVSRYFLAKRTPITG